MKQEISKGERINKPALIQVAEDLALKNERLGNLNTRLEQLLGRLGAPLSDFGLNSNEASPVKRDDNFLERLHEINEEFTIGLNLYEANVDRLSELV